MNYNRTIIITLLALLSLFVVSTARANEDFKIFTDNINDRINKIQADIDKRGVTTTTQRQAGGATVTVSKNYPIVPYDPNHPNVKKQSSINIKANAKTLAGRFARGLNAAALAYAVYDILGDGIDWVLDPNNNSINYYPPDGYLWLDHHQNIHPSKESAANYNCKIVEPCISVKSISVSSYNPDVFDVYIVSDNPAIYTAPSIQRLIATKEQSMSLDTIANHVINNEDNSTTNVITNNYYNAVSDTIVEQVQKGEHDNDIETAVSNVSQPDDSTSPSPSPSPAPAPDVVSQPSDKPQDETKPFELPAFCDWAKHVCDFIDWVKTDPPPPETPTYPKIKEIDKDYDINPDLYNASSQCPPPIQVNIGMGTIAIPYDSLCLFFTKNSPLIVAIAYLIGAFIIIGKR